ncbi:hypothetical protein [uncultured Pseudodesulfovibrio sp.]|uniref:hypothetical protein n=1 Tax=uncultured Pseudodesulfovibrio sp. TaxID=2035858 RepID=UPI0029C9A8A5|nr:hypothetical protein [uncultured Pseudodesulfovibrio sp.]
MSPSNNRSWVENNRPLILILLFLFSVTVRFVTAEYLDLGGDNATKWMEAHRLAEGMGVSYWYNHSMRWAINLPLAGLIKLFGPHPTLVYVLPFSMASLASLCICLIGEKIHSLKLGIAASVLTTLLPLMTLTGSQLWPGVFELGWTSIMTWIVLVWIDKRAAWILIIAGVCFFLGWGARVTELYMYPGIILLIWLPTKDFKAVMLFTAVSAGLCFAEWGWFWWDSGNSMGRLGLLNATRGNHQDLPITFTKYLMQFTELKKLKGLLPVTILTLIAGTFALREKDNRVKGIAALYLGYMVLILYMISGISPLKIALPFGSRYWPEAAPYGLLLLLWYLFKIKEKQPRTGVALIATLFIAFTAFTIKKIPPTNSVIQMARDYELIRPILAENKPIMMVYKPWQPNCVENILIQTFTGKRKRRSRLDREIHLDMRRNQQRIAALYLDDLHRFEQVKTVPLVRVEKHVYILPSSTYTGSDKSAAVSTFGRRLHAATLPDSNQ